MFATEHELPDGVYADICDDGLIVLKAERQGEEQQIYLEQHTLAALNELNERWRRAAAEFELLAERQEIATE